MWLPPFGVARGTNNRGDPEGRPGTRWRDYISQMVWDCLITSPQEELRDVAGIKDIQAALLALLPLRLMTGTSNLKWADG